MKQARKLATAYIMTIKKEEYKMKMKVKELIKLLQEYNEEDDVELVCYSMDCATAELSVEPCGDLLMEDSVG